MDMTDGQSDDDGLNGRTEDDMDEQRTTPTDGRDGRTNDDVNVRIGRTEEYGDKERSTDGRGGQAEGDGDGRMGRTDR